MKHRTAALLLTLVCLALPAAVLGQDTLYAVDFGTPPHTVGMPPVVGTGPAPRATPTAIVFGDPLVVAQLGDLTDQPCSFGNGTTGYDQLRFGVDPSYSEGFPVAYDDYYLRMDVTILQLTNDSFRIFCDLPTVHVVQFESAGVISFYPSGGPIGSYTPGTAVRVAIQLDIPGAEWTIFLDGSPVHTGPITGDRLSTIRLNLNGALADNSVGVDNFILIGGVPPGGIEESPEHPGIGDSRLAGRTLAPVPNPAADGAWIRWESARPSLVRIDILNAAGRRVWSRALSTGKTLESLRWDGRDLSGQRVPRGVYFIRIAAGSDLLGEEKLILVR